MMLILSRFLMNISNLLLCVVLAKKSTILLFTILMLLMGISLGLVFGLQQIIDENNVLGKQVLINPC